MSKKAEYYQITPSHRYNGYTYYTAKKRVGKDLLPCQLKRKQGGSYIECGISEFLTSKEKTL
jgi:hypothetical protein